jgi:PhoH-like ATPase
MKVSEIEGKNDEQKELIRAILDPAIDLIVLQGALGSGKTIVATACALELCRKSRHIDNIVISRPMVPDDNEEIGFLPGTEIEKLSPYLGGFYSAAQELDNLAGRMFYYSSMIMEEPPVQINTTKKKKPIECLTTAKSLATIKGCSYSNAVLILDEAQDATLSQLKKFIGRAGRHSKVIVMGDIGQKSNDGNTGFEKLIEAASESDKDFINVLKLIKVERSRLAEFANGL